MTRFAFGVGIYQVQRATFSNPAMDRTDKDITIFYPKYDNSTSPKPFRLVAYAHGYGGGGVYASATYQKICTDVASFGYVVALHHSCNVGCVEDEASLPGDPPGFAHYYFEQLKVIEWVKAQMGSLKPPDFTLNLNFNEGVAIAGHSMGGQATLFSSSYNSSDYNIKAACLHHPYTHNFPAPTVPFVVFTSEGDTTAPVEPMATGIFNAPGGAKIRGIVDKIDTDHHEPDMLNYNPLIGQFTAAWLKIYLDNTPQADGFDYEEMVFGASAISLCGGGDGAMVAKYCQFIRA